MTARPGFGALLDSVRDVGIGQVTLHVSVELLPALEGLSDQVDAVAVSSRSVDEATALVRLKPALGSHCTAVVQLTAAMKTRLTLVGRALVAARPNRVVLTWPFPPGDAPPPASECGQWLDTAVEDLDQAGVPVGIKGLPACLVGRYLSRL